MCAHRGTAHIAGWAQKGQAGYRWATSPKSVTAGAGSAGPAWAWAAQGGLFRDVAMFPARPFKGTSQVLVVMPLRPSELH